MSLADYRAQRKAAIEDGAFSEEFSIVGSSVTFKGIFESSPMQSGEDSGNLARNTLSIRILVDTIPAGLVQRVTQIRRDDGTTFTFNFSDVDQEGVSLIWLY